ncbi:MAG: hypothetical protein HY758_04995 [Nitrospirae bacterium]|nr:hypothetical protein [Nitrospirota bacterium]
MRYSFILLMFIGLLFIGCASTAPLPTTLNIVPPSSDVPSEIAAFSGKWEGRFYGGVDIALVVEKVNVENADIIVSMGGIAGWYQYMKAKVISGPALYAVSTGGNTITFSMKSNNELYIVTEEKVTGSKSKGELSRSK